MRGLAWLGLAAAAGCGSSGQGGPPDATFVVRDFAEPVDLAVPPDFATPLADLAMACDPFAPNCTAPATRCTVVQSIGQTQVECVVPEGSGAIGAQCTRDADLGSGFDDCAAGYCSSTGDPDIVRRCRAFCRTDGDCMAGEACVGPFSQTLREGFCAPKCTLFGGTCMGGQACSQIFADLDGATSYALCHVPGAQQAGQSCGNGPCGIGLACLDPAKTGMPLCYPLCDGGHPCGMGNCNPIPGLGGGGYCG